MNPYTVLLVLCACYLSNTFGDQAYNGNYNYLPSVYDKNTEYNPGYIRDPHYLPAHPSDNLPYESTKVSFQHQHYIPPEQSRHHWLLEKIKHKLNLYAIGKILLKLLIFKKIVKFIGLICFLLFLPKLKELVTPDNTDMEMDNERARMSRLIDEISAKYGIK